MTFLHELLSSDLAYRLGWTLLHSLWQGAAVAAVFGLAMLLIPRARANARYLTGCACLAAILAASAVTFVAVDPPARRTPAPALAAEPEHARPAATESLNNAANPPERPHTPILVQQIQPRAYERAPGWRERLRALAAADWNPHLAWLAAMWLLGVVILSVWRLGGLLATWRLRRVGVAAASDETCAVVARLGRRLRISRPVRVLRSAVVGTPAVIGHLRPIILLPVSAVTALSPDELQAILAHELAHIRRHDYIINIVQTVIETVLFHHPAVWWISHRVRAERENCCDDLAVATCGDRVTYARALAQVQEIEACSAGLAAAATGGSVLFRMQRILGLPRARLKLLERWPAGALIFLTLAVAGGLHLRARAQDAKAKGSPQLAGDAALAAEQARFLRTSRASSTSPANRASIPVSQPGLLRLEFKGTKLAEAVEQFANGAGLPLFGAENIDPATRQKAITFAPGKLLMFDEALTAFDEVLFRLNYWMIRRERGLVIKPVTEWYRDIPPVNWFSTTVGFHQARLPAWEMAHLTYRPYVVEAETLAKIVNAALPVNALRVQAVEEGRNLELKGFVYFLDYAIAIVEKRDSGLPLASQPAARTVGIRRIRRGDWLSMRATNLPRDEEIDVSQTVDENGEIYLPVIGKLKAEALTPSALRDSIIAAGRKIGIYPKDLNPGVFVELSPAGGLRHPVAASRPALPENWSKLRVSVRKAGSGEPVSSARVELRGKAFAEDNVSLQEQTDAHGIASFGPIRPGVYYFSISVSVDGLPLTSTGNATLYGAQVREQVITVPAELLLSHITFRIKTPEFLRKPDLLIVYSVLPRRNIDTDGTIWLPVYSPRIAIGEEGIGWGVPRGSDPRCGLTADKKPLDWTAGSYQITRIEIYQRDQDSIRAVRSGAQFCWRPVVNHYPKDLQFDVKPGGALIEFSLPEEIVQAVLKSGDVKKSVSISIPALAGRKDEFILRLVDTQGRALSNVHVGTFATRSHEGFTVAGQSGWSDAEGRLVFPASNLLEAANRRKPGSRSAALYALDKQRNLAGLREIVPDDAGKELQWTLEPAILIRGQIESADLARTGRKIEWANVLGYWQDHWILENSTTDQRIEVVLPPGDYRFDAYGTDVDRVAQPVRVEPGRPEQTLLLELPISKLAILYGQPAPELRNITAWKNGGPLKLSDLRGKVVLLYFWRVSTDRQDPYVTHLAELHQELGDKGLAIIGIHDSTATSMEDLAAKFAQASQYWAGKSIQFPVALEGPAEPPSPKAILRSVNAAAYGIEDRHATVLVDKEGRIAGKYRKLMEDGKLELKRMLGVREAPEAPKGPDDKWRKRFNEVYNLEDGEVVKRIAPPFIPERLRYYQEERASDAQSNPDPPDYFQFRWDSTLKDFGSGFRSRTPLTHVLGIMGLGRDQYEGDPKLLDLEVPGDWIVREGSSPEARLRDLEEILREQLHRNIRFELRQVEGEVVVARGEYTFAPLVGIATHDEEAVHLFADKLDPDGGAGGGTDDLAGLFRHLGSRMNVRIVNETRSTPDLKVYWANHKSSRLHVPDSQERSAKVEMVFANVARQTSLQFKRERRAVPIWSVIEEE